MELYHRPEAAGWMMLLFGLRPLVAVVIVVVVSVATAWLNNANRQHRYLAEAAERATAGLSPSEIASEPAVPRGPFRRSKILGDVVPSPWLLGVRQ